MAAQQLVDEIAGAAIIIISDKGLFFHVLQAETGLSGICAFLGDDQKEFLVEDMKIVDVGTFDFGSKGNVQRIFL